jgi:hypothetical protein
LRKYAAGRLETVVRSFEERRARAAGVKGRALTKGFKKVLVKRGAISAAAKRGGSGGRGRRL